MRAELDVAAMARAATALEGRHDFSAFGGADPQPVRTVHRIRVRRTGSTVTIDVRADAFLRGMVRRIVATLLAVGMGQAGGLGGGRRCSPPGRRPSQAPRRRRGGSASGASSSDGGLANGDDDNDTNENDTGHED